MMEIGSAEGTHTVVSLADGTTSLYASAGGGAVGGGAHSSVVAATRHFLAMIEVHLASFEADGDPPPVPTDGRITFRALTYGGRRCVDAAESDLRGAGHILAPLYLAGNSVIDRLRAVEGVGYF